MLKLCVLCVYVFQKNVIQKIDALKKYLLSTWLTIRYLAFFLWAFWDKGTPQYFQEKAAILSLFQTNFTQTLVQIFSCRNRRICRRFIGWNGLWQARQIHLTDRVQEKRNRKTRQMPFRTRWIDHAVGRWFQIIIGQTLQHIADVNHDFRFFGNDIFPRIFFGQQLQTACRCADQKRN